MMLKSLPKTRVYIACIGTLFVIAQALIAHAGTECVGTNDEVPNASGNSVNYQLNITRSSYISWDAVLHRKWLHIANCKHPDWPNRLVLSDGKSGEISAILPPTKSMTTVPSKNSPTVHVGETVLLWKVDGFARIEVAGISEESGVMDQRI